MENFRVNFTSYSIPTFSEVGEAFNKMCAATSGAISHFAQQVSGQTSLASALVKGSFVILPSTAFLFYRAYSKGKEAGETKSFVAQRISIQPLKKIALFTVSATAVENILIFAGKLSTVSLGIGTISFGVTSLATGSAITALFLAYRFTYNLGIDKGEDTKATKSAQDEMKRKAEEAEREKQADQRDRERYGIELS